MKEALQKEDFEKAADIEVLIGHVSTSLEEEIGAIAEVSHKMLLEALTAKVRLICGFVNYEPVSFDKWQQFCPAGDHGHQAKVTASGDPVQAQVAAKRTASTARKHAQQG